MRTDTIKVVLAVFALSCCLCSVAASDTLSLAESTADTGLRKGSATTNYGTATTNLLGRGASATAILRLVVSFNFGALPAGARITQARLALYQNAVSGDHATLPTVYSVCRSTQSNWTELGATWNTYDGTNAWAVVGGDYTETDKATLTVSDNNINEFRTWDVTTQAVYWQTHGKVLHAVVKSDAEETNNYFLTMAMREAAGSQFRPTMTITYYMPGSTKAMTLKLW